MSFSKKIITLKFELGTGGSFGNDGSNVVELSGLRCTANITKSGGVSMSNLQLAVWGMDLDTMNKLTVIDTLLPTDTRRNLITVSAGDTEGGVAVCFSGIISEAWVDASNPPDVRFVVSAFTGMIDAVRPVPAVSYRGTVDVVTVLSGIAAQMQPPRGIENSGVDAKINAPYLAGTLLDQAKAIGRAADINILLDDNPSPVMAIWPAGGTRSGQIPILSRETGMVGYPAFAQNQVQVTTLYNPALVFGGKVEIQSDLTTANGTWAIASVAHNLSCEVPGGPWFTQIICYTIGKAAPIVR